MPRFVVLLHELPAGDGRKTHWDFMLECGGVLKTWALAEEPQVRREIAAEQLPDHRLAYLDYEGPVSGNRGVVSQFDAGSYSEVSMDAAEIAVQLDGRRLKGMARLQQSASDQRWIFSLSN
jgi:hypothetical protein